MEVIGETPEEKKLRESFETEELIIDVIGYGTAFAITVVGGSMFLNSLVDQYKKINKALEAPDVDKEIKITNIDGNKITFTQEDKVYTIENAKISEELKTKLIEKNPELEKFLNNGEIKVFKEEN